MNISYRWLLEIAPGIRDTPEALADRLGMLGAPVEELARPGAGLEDIIVARVLEARPHPDADRLSLCRVDPGDGAPVEVVCGAPNVEIGALYPFAPVGASLPGGVRIRRTKIRGQNSNGMLCSERELGLGREHEGIMRLADDLQTGERLADALGLDDVRFVLEVTPNRPDLLSHVGVARELAPDGHHGIELPPFSRDDWDEPTDATMPPIDFRRADSDGQVGGVRVCVDDAAGCPRYIAAIIDDVSVGPSPEWLRSRLRAIGQRPINNVVDATNYVLHELGQPLHAFDAQRLEGAAILVRRARHEEGIVTLDEAERALGEAVLVIADAASPIAVAGVMGGLHSEVSPSTTRVLLECACFDPGSVRAAARDLGLSTDASYRFERGVDLDGMELAVHRAVELIQVVAGGRIVGEALDVFPAPADPPVVRLRPSRVERVLGQHLPPAGIQEMLVHIGFELRDAGADHMDFVVPGFRRHDVRREIDLIEEVARRHGYDRFEESLRSHRPTVLPDAPMSALEDRLRDRLVGRGLLEARSVPMAPEGAGVVALQRPLSAEEGVLRSTLAHGLARAAELNMARGVRDVRLFEIGTTFHPSSPGDLPEEQTRVAVLVSGRRRPVHWSGEAPDWDLWDAKALAEDLAADLGLDAGSVTPLSGDAGALVLPGFYLESATFAVAAGDELVGVAGEVTRDALDRPAWAAPAFAVEIRLTEAMTNRRRPGIRPLPRQPATDRDLALLVPRTLPAADVAATIRAEAGPLLEDLRLFDLYTGSGVAAGQRSLAFRLVFRDPERTLKDPEVDAIVDRVLNRLKDAHGVERRA